MAFSALQAMTEEEFDGARPGAVARTPRCRGAFSDSAAASAEPLRPPYPC